MHHSLVCQCYKNQRFGLLYSFSPWIQKRFRIGTETGQRPVSVLGDRQTDMACLVQNGTTSNGKSWSQIAVDNYKCFIKICCILSNHVIVLSFKHINLSKFRVVTIHQLLTVTLTEGIKSFAVNCFRNRCISLFILGIYNTLLAEFSFLIQKAY